MNFKKELNKKIKNSDQLQKAIAYYERGLITFSECLQLIYETEKEETIKRCMEG